MDATATSAAPFTGSEGARVLVHGKYAGVVRYVPDGLSSPNGEINDEAALLVGVELDRARGDSDGSAPDGRRLFECKPNFGLFVRPDKLAPFSPQDAAACTVQSAWLRFRAAQKFRQLVFAHAWNLLDNNQEQLNLKRSAQFKSAEHTLAQLTNQNSLTRATSDLSKLTVSASYRGPHVKWPLRLSNVLQLLESFKHGVVLHHKYVVEILQAAIKTLAPLPTLQEIVLAEGEKLTVVGDLHGQLQDLYTIFAINGLPSPSNKYLFNGDFVDRGLYGTEVVLTLLMFMLLYPKSVFLNRGNHESRNQNSWMGFEDEIWSKYSGLDGDDDEKDPDRPVDIFEQFQTLFENLPLCALLQQKIVVVHGGLFSRDNVTLAHLKAISRKREPPLHQTGFEDKLFEDMLWSDPRAISSRQPSERGAGVEFGVDVTNNFCLVNRVALIIRSHECVQEGFEILHGGRLITLFSASRYCGTQMNKGAFLTLGPDLQPEIQQFYARTIDSIELSASTSESAISASEEQARKEEEEATQQREVAAMQGVLEEDTLRMIAERICDHRPSLFWYFTQHDQEHHGAVPRLVWAEALRSVLQLDLPFLTYQKQLADADEATGLINYSRFLARYRIENDAIDNSGWQESIIALICKKLFIAMGAGDLNQAFQVFDADANGFIDYDEFSSALKKMDNGLSDQQVFALMRTADANDDGRIDFAEFAQRFEVIFTNNARPASGSVSLASSVHEDQVEDAEELPEPSPSPLPSPSQLTPDVDDAAKATSSLPPPPPPPSSSDEPVFARRVSSVDEAQPTFAPTPAPDIDVETMDALLQIGKALLARAGSLKYHFYHFDVNQDGVLSRDEFEKALAKLGFNFSSELLVRIMNAVDTDGGHSIDFNEFVAAFAVQDVREKQVLDAGDLTWQNAVLQQVSNVFYQHRIHIRNAFRMFDRSNTGFITKDEFRTGLSAFNVVLNSPLSDDQIEELLAFLDSNKDGVISYKEFFDGFRVVDVRLEGGQQPSAPSMSDEDARSVASSMSE